MTSDSPSSSDNPSPEEPKKTFPDPAFVEVKGYADFPDLADLFEDEYVRGEPLIDVRGIHINFHSRKPNNFRDFEHAAIGKEGVEGEEPQPCNIERASFCVYWIRFVVTHPDVEIFRSPVNDGPKDQERDVYRWKGQKGPGQPFYYYKVVVTRYFNNLEKTHFLTAYNIKPADYNRINATHKQIYPLRLKR